MDPIKLSEDGKTIEFKPLEKLPTTPKKFRNSVEINELYRFIYENDIRRETLRIVNEHYLDRKKAKAAKKKKK